MHRLQLERVQRPAHSKGNRQWHSQLHVADLQGPQRPLKNGCHISCCSGCIVAMRFQEGRRHVRHEAAAQGKGQARTAPRLLRSMLPCLLLPCLLLPCLLRVLRSRRIAANRPLCRDSTMLGCQRVQCGMAGHKRCRGHVRQRASQHVQQNGLVQLAAALQTQRITTR